VEALLALGAYDPIVQQTEIQAQYYHDPKDERGYLRWNVLMPDINNEKDQKNETYKQNMLSLNLLVLFKFTLDTVVVPRESEWFGYYSPHQNSVVIPMNETDGYLGDWIGLKTLDSLGKIVLGSSPFNHMKFTLAWFGENVIVPYLNNTIGE